MRVRIRRGTAEIGVNCIEVEAQGVHPAGPIVGQETLKQAVAV